MQDDIEIFGEINKNNPFWTFFDSPFEPLEVVATPEIQEISPPNDALPIEAYSFYGLAFVIAVIALLLVKKHERRRASNFPKIYFDEKHNWYCYKFNEKKASLMTGDEAWIPKAFYFDINKEGFFHDKGDGELEKRASIDELRKAGHSKIPSLLIPTIIVAVGFLLNAYVFQLKSNTQYENYLGQVVEREYQLSLFDPFEGMCQLNSKSSLIPQQMTVQIVYDMPEGSNPPIAIEQYNYLEGDTLMISGEEIMLRTQLFLHNSPDQIVGDAAQQINFRERAGGHENCSQGNTYFLEPDPVTDSSVAYVVPINELKEFTLGLESGLYETKLFGIYDEMLLLNASSYEVRTVQYKYSIDNIPGCESITEGMTYMPGYMGNGGGFQGKIVPWGTSPAETINVPDFQMCSSVLHFEYL